MNTGPHACLSVNIFILVPAVKKINYTHRIKSPKTLKMQSSDTFHQKFKEKTKHQKSGLLLILCSKTPSVVKQ